MEKPLPAQPPTGDAPAPPPMLGLVALLRAQGFLVTTDDYVHLLKILERYGNEPPESLALRICPIIAMTPEEQRRFYPILASYFREQAAPVPVRRLWRIWEKALWLVFAALLAIAVIFLARKPSLEFPAAAPLSLPKDSPYVFDLLQTGMFAGREADTAVLRIHWEDSGRGKIGEGLRIRHTFKEPGRHVVRATASGTLPLKNAGFRQEVNVCEALIETRIYGAEEVVPAGRSFTLHAASQPPVAGAYDWDTAAFAGIGSFRILSDSSISLRFDTPGIYSIRAWPRGLATQAYCLSGGEANIQVEDTARQFELSFTPGAMPALHKSLRPAATLAALLFLAAIGFWGFRRRRKKESPAPPEPTSGRPPASALKPPYEVPFPPPASGDISLDKPLQRFLQLLRFRAEEELLLPDLLASIRASIRRGGLEELVLTPQRRIQEYLLFIDASQPQGLLHALYGQLARWIEAEGIPATLFYYDHDFQCTASHSAQPANLRSVADAYPDAIPIILGDGAALMHPFGGAVLPDMLEQLRRWDAVMLITPLPRETWSSRERLLAQHLLLAAADAPALQRLAQDFKAGRKPRWERMAGGEADIRNFKSAEALEAYFGNDEALFQWLCALCIYPKPRWELLVAFGKAVLPRYGRDEDLRYDILLRFCRIPWLAAGSFPQRLRMELLKALKPENEVAARTALLDLMRKVRSHHAGDYFFSDEQRLQESISGFVLYARDAARFAAFEGLSKQFRKLLDAGEVTDVPARKYLEGGDWQTPLQSGGKTLGLHRFLEAQERQRQEAEDFTQRKRRIALRRRRLLAAAGMAAVLGIWLFLRFSNAPQNMAALSGWYDADPAQLIALRYDVQADFRACGDSSGRLRVLPATLEASGKPYGMRFDAQQQTLSAMVPFAALSGALPSLQVGISGSNVPEGLQLAQASATGVLRLQCRNGLPAVAGAADSLPPFLNEIWSGSRNTRLLNINLSRGMVYYSTGGADTWGSYRIDTVVSLQGNGGKRFQIVMQAYPGFAVMFIGNASERGFNLAFCPQRWKTQAEALKAPADCAAPDGMQLYYRDDRPRLVELPVTRPGGANPPLVASEAAKIQALLGGRQAAGSILSLTRFTNRNFLNMRDFSLSELRSMLGDAYVQARLVRKKETLPKQVNPFRREMLQLEWMASPQPAQSPRPGIVPPNSSLPGKPRPGNTNDAGIFSDTNDYSRTQADANSVATWQKMIHSGNAAEAQEARYHLADYYLKQHDEKQAVNLLQQNISSGGPLSSWRISSYLLLADFYEKNGSKSQAIQLLERALKESLDPATSQQIRLRLKALQQKAPAKY